VLLFKLPDGRRYVHCGDMRYDGSTMASCPILARFRGAEAVYLDNTYCHTRHTFPPQRVAVDYIAGTVAAGLAADAAADAAGAPFDAGADEAAADAADGAEAPAGEAAAAAAAAEEELPPLPPRPPGFVPFRSLYLISTYNIGKERVLTAAAAAAGRRIYVPERRLGALRCVLPAAAVAAM